MKKYFALILAVMLLYACGGGSAKNKLVGKWVSSEKTDRGLETTTVYEYAENGDYRCTVKYHSPTVPVDMFNMDITGKYEMKGDSAIAITGLQSKIGGATVPGDDLTQKIIRLDDEILEIDTKGATEKCQRQ